MAKIQQVSELAIIREMDADELMEFISTKTKSDYKTFNDLALIEAASIQYYQLTGKSYYQ